MLFVEEFLSALSRVTEDAMEWQVDEVSPHVATVIVLKHDLSVNCWLASLSLDDRWTLSPRKVSWDDVATVTDPEEREWIPMPQPTAIETPLKSYERSFQARTSQRET